MLNLPFIAVWLQLQISPFGEFPQILRESRFAQEVFARLSRTTFGAGQF